MIKKPHASSLPCYTTSDEAAGKPLPIDQPRRTSPSGYVIPPEKLAALHADLDLILNNYPAFLKKKELEIAMMQAHDPDVISFDPQVLAVAGAKLREERKKNKLFEDED